MSSSSSLSSTSSSSASPSTSSAAASLQVPGNLKIVGIILAIVSGLLIGSSFVFKKKGLLRSQAGGAAGEGVAYLKSPLWWTGMTMMILGELCNFAAYAFVEAIVVTPMGALSVVICAILSSFFLKEKLSFFGWLGCGLCIIGSVIIALNGPQEASVGRIRDFQKLFLAPGFLVYGSILIAAALVIIVFVAPKYGKKSMLWYILVCSMIGGISVSVTTGLGSAIVTSIMGDNQFKYWFIYFLLVFIIVTLVTEVYYLNVALALFNTAMVTPTYYVIFTFFSILTTIVLFQGLKAPPTQIITLVMGFIVICFGITILQLSKVDPTQIKSLDRRSTILLQAARNNTEGMDEKSLSAMEDPGMDALRGSFGAMGSIMRAKSAKRMSISSRATTSSLRSRNGHQSDLERHPLPGTMTGGNVNGRPDFLAGVKRHQLYDPPMPTSDTDSIEGISMTSQASSFAGGLPSNPRPNPRKQTIKFGTEDMVHQYSKPGIGENTAKHESRSVVHSGVPSYMPLDSQGSTSTVHLPSPSEDFGGLRSAPPMLSDLEDADPFHRPRHTDPFANAPLTTTLTTFPSVSTITSTTSSTIDSPSDTTSSRHPLSSSRRSGGSSTHHLFGRASSAKIYPRGDRQDDRDESESLWHRRSEEESDVGVEGEGEGDGVEKHAQNSVRLVSNTNRF